MLSNRWRLGAMGLGVVALAASLSACGSSSPSSSATGGSTGTSGTTVKTLTIGQDTTLSGPAAPYGVTAVGAEAYFTMINSEGGVKAGNVTYKFKSVKLDNAYSPSQAASVARELVSQDNAFAIYLEGTPPLEGVLPVAKTIGVPIFAAADGGLLTPPKEANVFGGNPDYRRESEFEAEFAIKTLHASTVALVYENDGLGLPAKTVLPKYAASIGGKVTPVIPIAVTVTDFAPFVSKLQSANAKDVICFAGTTVCAKLQAAAAASNYKPTWITLFTPFAPTYHKLAGSSMTGMYGDDYMYPITRTTTNVKQYVKTMTSFDKTALHTIQAQQGWNFAAMTIEAIRIATAGGKKLTTASFEAALTSTTMHKPVGLLPGVDFTATSHAAATKSQMYKFTANGTFKTAGPMTTLPPVAS